VTEEWIPIERAPLYEVNRIGQIRHRVRKEVRATRPRDGYPSITVKVEGRWIHLDCHRVVAEAFLGTPPTPRHEVAHIDGNRLNSAVENLAWKTSSENKMDRVVHGTVNSPKGSAHHMAKLTEDSVRQARVWEAEGKTQRAIAAMLGVSQGAVYHALRGHSWRHT
jgi:hypothetical protein